MKPEKMWITVQFELSMDNWDDDVDWTDPKKVLEDQIDSVGLAEVLHDAVGTDTLSITYQSGQVATVTEFIKFE